jgi:hypothetical protein
VKTRQLAQHGKRLAQAQQEASALGFLLTAVSLWGVMLTPLLGIRFPAVNRFYTSYWGLLPLTFCLLLVGCLIRSLKKGVGVGIVVFVVVVLLAASSAFVWLFVLPYTREAFNWP